MLTKACFEFMNMPRMWVASPKCPPRAVNICIFVISALLQIVWGDELSLGRNCHAPLALIMCGFFRISASASSSWRRRTGDRPCQEPEPDGEVSI